MVAYQWFHPKYYLLLTLSAYNQHHLSRIKQHLYDILIVEGQCSLRVRTGWLRTRVDRTLLAQQHVLSTIFEISCHRGTFGCHSEEDIGAIDNPYTTPIVAVRWFMRQHSATEDTHTCLA